jgi:hypothetical protein
MKTAVESQKAFIIACLGLLLSMLHVKWMENLSRSGLSQIFGLARGEGISIYVLSKEG